MAEIGNMLIALEIDPFCSRLLARHYPDVPNLGISLSGVIGHLSTCWLPARLPDPSPSTANARD